MKQCQVYQRAILGGKSSQRHTEINVNKGTEIKAKNMSLRLTVTYNSSRT